jgi:hypothetical protein
MAKSSARSASTPLQRLLAAHERGDIVTTRALAHALLGGQPSEAESKMAKELLERTEVEPALWAYAGFAAAIIAVLILLAILRT